MNRSDIELRQGWYWPKSDLRCWDYMLRYPDLPQRIMPYVRSRRSMIQAGGNAGYYTKQYAALFDHVYTFEPDHINFACLCLNVTEPNTVKLQACIGDQHGMVGLNVNEANRGKTHVSGTGMIPRLTIDDLRVDDCDLIHLDVEGYEYFALKGAAETISRCRPTVVVEVWPQLDDRFGEGMNAKTHEFLAGLGYGMREILDGSDRVYVHEASGI